MDDTPVSLLDRLHDRPTPESWQRLVDLYTPLIGKWLRRHALQPPDKDDLVQDILGVVVSKLPEFRHDGRAGAFRRWLRTITVNCLRHFWRSRRSQPLGTGDSHVEELLDQLADPHSGLSRLWDRDHDRHVQQRLLELIAADFQPQTWQAFRRLVLDGARVEVVAAELGLSVESVWQAKSRVLKKLRQEARGLLD